MKQCIYLIFLYFACLASVVAQPSPESYMQFANSTQPVSKEMVGKVYGAYKALLTEFKDYQSNGDAKGIAAYWQANNANNKATSIVTKHGFKDAMDWYANFMRVVQVYAAYKMQDSKMQLPQLDQQLAAIQNNASLTAEQKQYAMQMIKSSQGMMQGMMNVSAAEIKAFEPYAAKFDALLSSK